MAGQYDGTILINTSIDTDGFKAGGKEVEAAMRKAAQSVKNIGDTAKISLQKSVEAFAKQNQQVAAQQQKVEGLRKELERLGNTKVKTDQYTSLEKNVESLEKQLDKLQEKKKQAEESGNAFRVTQEYKAAEREVTRLENALTRAIERKARFEENGGKRSSNTYRNMLDDVQKLEKQLDLANQDKERLFSTSTQKTSSFQKLEEDIQNVKKNLKAAATEKAFLESSGKAYQPADTSAVEGKYIAESEKLQQMNTRLGLSYDALKAKIASLNKSTSESTGIKGRLASAIGALGAKIKGILPGMNQMDKSAKKSGLSLKKLLMYGLGFRSLFALFNRLRSAVISGFQNLSQYSGQTNADISMLMSSLTQLKNSLATAFAPILSVVAPILSKFIGMLSTAASYVSQFMSALTGKSTYIKAVKVQQDYAAGLKKTGDSAKDAEKDLEGYLSPLDEINKMEKKDTDTSSGSGAGGGVDPSKMFETKPIESNVMSLAEKVKKAFAEMFAPLADAWQIYGPSIKKSLGNIKQDFVDFFVEIGTATVDWAKNLDWKPLLASVDNLLQKLEPLVDLILGGLAWAYENVLLPLGKWTIEKGLPAVINLLAQAFEFVAAVLEALKPVAQWLWDHILKDLAATVGEVVVGIINTFTGLLEFFTGVFSGDWEKAIEGLKTMHDGLEQAVMAVFNFIQNNIMIPFDNFLQKVFAVDFTKYFGIFGDVMNGFFAGAKTVWDGVKNIFNGFITFLKGIFAGNWRQALTGLVQIFSGVFQTIEGFAKIPINGVIGLINGMISAITSGLNWVVKKVNTLSFDIPDWVPEIGGKHFGFDFSTFTAPKIPYLATGAVIPANAPFTAVLGDQKHGNNIEAPEALIRKIVREESGSRGGTYHFTGQINRRVLFDEFITEAKLRQDQTGVNPLTSF